MLILPVLLVLASGVAHAVWNLLTKQSANKHLFLCLIFVPSTVLLLPSTVREVARPDLPVSVYWLLLASLAIQSGYSYFLARSYTYGDMSQVYPMMRGISSFLLPVVSVIFLNEHLTVLGWVGLLSIASGFGLTSGLAFMRSQVRIPLRVILYTIGVGMCTTSYVFVDKLNLAYFSPLALLEVSNIGFMLGLIPFIKFKEVEWAKEWRDNGKLLTLGSVLSPGSYLLFLFAMSMSPLTYVSPLREIGTVIGTVAGIYLLKEKRDLTRIVSACLIFAGILLVGIWGI